MWKKVWKRRMKKHGFYIFLFSCVGIQYVLDLFLENVKIQQVSQLSNSFTCITITLPWLNKNLIWTTFKEKTWCFKNKNLSRVNTRLNDFFCCCCESCVVAWIQSRILAASALIQTRQCLMELLAIVWQTSGCLVGDWCTQGHGGELY